jgi:hypothetical protein
MTAWLALPPSVPDDHQHASGRRETMSRIPRPSHGLVAAAVALLTALAAAALPLAALADGGPPLGF